MWIAAAGSDQSTADAKQQLSDALANPAAELQSKIASRQRLGSNTQVSLPGDRLLQNAITWGKQNLADLTQTASNLQIRWTNQGKQFPAPLGTVAHADVVRRGVPGLSVDLRHRRRVHGVCGGGPRPVPDDRGSPAGAADISKILNNDSGVVVHETVSDGSVWFGHDSQTTNADGSKTNDFNTDETIKFPSAVALVWRWTGDNKFMASMYPFAKKNLQYVDQKLDVDHDGWPEGSGNVERTGMGPEKLDNGVYYIRALLDLADMAKVRHDNADGQVGHASRQQAAQAVRQHLVGHAGPAVRGLAVQPRQHAELPEALDRRGADGGPAHARRQRRSGRRSVGPRDDCA